MAILDFLSSKVGAWSASVWDGLVRAIDARFKPLEEQLDIQRATTDAIVSRGLNVIEDELAPVVAQGQDVLTAINAVKASADDVHDDLVAMRDEGIDPDHILTDATARFTSDAEMGAKATPADITAAIDALKDGTSSALDTLNELAAALGDDPDFAGTIIAALGERVRYDAPQVKSSIEQAQARSNIIAGHALMGLRSMNALVNPFMQVSQQYGSGALTAFFAYGADQKAVHGVGSVGISHGRKAASFTGVSVPVPYMYEINVTTADGSLDAGDLLFFHEMIEADRFGGAFNFGTTHAVNALVALYLEANYSGKVALSLRNNTSSRSYVRDIDVVANVPAMHVIEIPGDTSGVWPSLAGSRGGSLAICMSCGSSFQGAANEWVDGNCVATAATSHGAGTLNNRLRLLPIGMFPKRLGLTKAMLEGLSLADWMWLMQPYPVDAETCRRYWQLSGQYARGIWTNSATIRIAQELPTIMRSPPAATLLSATPTVEKWAHTSHVGSGSTIITNSSTEKVLQVVMDGFSTSNVRDDPAYMAANYIELSARF